MKKKLYLFNEFLNAFLYRKNPVYLIQFVTERCNARCTHCFIDFKKEKKEISIDKIEKLASASGNCLRNVALTGGEPFLRKDLFEIADIWFLNSTAKTISITTNGSMPERIEEFCQKISKRDIHVFFLFSYDFIAEKHSEYRSLKDLHLNVLESHKIIRKYSPKIQSIFQLTVNENNYECAINTYNYMKNNLGIDNINCSITGVIPDWDSVNPNGGKGFFFLSFENIKVTNCKFDNIFYSACVWSEGARNVIIENEY